VTPQRPEVTLPQERGRGRLDPGEIEALLRSGGRALDGRAAPARGLTLERVIYPNTRRESPSARGAEANTAGTREQES
jgi:tRNA U38,U39,U40 pseudouridine synthase TruA